ncbi:MAG: acyl carrier protein [Planctomycetota bacterium]|nr:MAG: acyl carrier protein [Planctomycetota bacterium]
MNDAEIQIAIKDIIAQIAPDEDLSQLDPKLRLREQIELDSMDFLDIVMELRKLYGVHVPEADYKELATLDGCVSYLRPHLASRSLHVLSKAAAARV